MLKQSNINGLKVERLNNGKPILAARKDHPWENEVVFNPACILLNDGDEIERMLDSLAPSHDIYSRIRSMKAVCALVYRAQGTVTEVEDFRKSRFGFALLSPELELLYRHDSPIVVPEFAYEDLGVEDPRITRVDGKFMMCYAGYSSHGATEINPVQRNRINICVASSEDLVHWKKKGPLNGSLNAVNNKNAAFFPSKLDGKFYMLHRPMEGPGAMAVHIAHSNSIDGEWTDEGVLFSAANDARFTRSWVGAGAPPLALADNSLILIYHTGHYKSDGTREYDLGICRITYNGSFKLLSRTDRFMVPEAESEIIGNETLGVNNVLFACGAYFYGEYIYFPYAGADSRIFGARIKTDFVP